MVFALVLEAAIAGAVFGMRRAVLTLAGGWLLFAVLTAAAFFPSRPAPFDRTLILAATMTAAAWSGARLARRSR